MLLPLRVLCTLSGVLSMPTPDARAAILVWGELLWDRFPDGSVLGGAPANVAHHLALLSSPPCRLPLFPRLITRVGDDLEGATALASLHRAIDASLLQIDASRATGEVEVVVDGESARYRLVPDRAWEHIAVTPAVSAALPSARALVFGTLSQRTAEGLARFTSLVEQLPRDCLRVCDPNLRPGRIDLPALSHALQHANVIKLGADELAVCAKAMNDSDLLGTLRQRCKLVAITRGAAGATLYQGNDVVEVPATNSLPGGDNVGCGDAYVAVLTAGTILGWSLEMIGRVASRWSAVVASKRGATPPFSDDECCHALFAP